MLIERGTIVGDYRVEGILGRGATAVVYSASHVGLKRSVALKVLAPELGSSPEFIARFRREGEMQASLEHPHAITVYEAGESDYGLYLAMRLIAGPTLATLNAERALDARRTMLLLAQLADALDAIHAAGFVHRDVKPQNVLVGDSDDAYLGDFGLMRAGGAGELTATGGLVGTVAYLAPEVVAGGEAVAASDRYAFAAMAFECLVGSVVYPRGTVAAILFGHASEPPPRICERRPELPQSLDQLFARGLAKHPAQRESSTRGFVDSVGAALQAAGAEALGPPPSVIAALDPNTLQPAATGPASHTRISTPARRRGLKWLAAAAVAGAGIALGAQALIGDQPQAPAFEQPAALLAGAQALGSKLDVAGTTLDCRGHSPPGPDSPSCTIMQTRLQGATLVVPQDGVIRRWDVRSAHGEISLAVLRPRHGTVFQVARSQNEFAENDSVYSFPTNLAVDRGDRLGVVLVAGAGVGVRAGVRGAATDRWVPRLQGPQKSKHLPPGSGFDDELLLRAEYLPGAPQQLPHQVSGAAALNLPAGHVALDRIKRLKDGRRVDIELVALGRRYVLDELVDGHRTARIDVPDFRLGGRFITFEVDVDDTGEGTEIYIEWVGEDSTRVLNHYYAGDPSGFEFVQ